jgi:two-component system, NarL family, invasion response regulator UvrY
MAISLYNSEEMIWQLIKCGAEGFICKNDDPNRLKKAIIEMMNTGCFFSDHIASKMVKKAIQTGELSMNNNLTEKEIAFLKLLCTEKTYKEIAKEMGLAERQTEYMRMGLFDKFGVKSRTRLAVIAMDKGLTI